MRVFLYIRKSWQVNVLHVFLPLLCFCTHTQALGRLPTPPSTVAVLPHNKEHNRFKNIYPCELLCACDKYTKAYWDNTALEPLIMDTLNTNITLIPCLYKWKNHFYEMKGDVGMSVHEKESKQEDAYTKTQTHS